VRATRPTGFADERESHSSSIVPILPPYSMYPGYIECVKYCQYFKHRHCAPLALTNVHKDDVHRPSQSHTTAAHAGAGNCTLPRQSALPTHTLPRSNARADIRRHTHAHKGRIRWPVGGSRSERVFWLLL